MGYIIVGSIFLLATIACFLWTALRRREPDADNLFLPEPGDTDAEIREKHLFCCCLAGNDAYPANYCPFEECTPEREQWIAGWMMAARGQMMDGRERHPDNPSCRHPTRRQFSD